MNFAKYDATGKVLYYGDIHPDFLELQGPNIFVGVIDGDTHYVLGGVSTLRATNPTTISGLVLSNIPSGSVLKINAASYPVTGSTVTLEFTYPGVYKIVMESFPYLDFKTEITV